MRVATSLRGGSCGVAASEIIADLRSQLQGKAPRLVTVFASTKQPLGELLPLFQAAFPDAVVMGSSTAGEFIQSGDAKGSVSVAAVAGALRVRAGMSVGLSQDVEGAVAGALRDIPVSLDGYPHRTALMLVDPLSGKGEEATLIAAMQLGEVPLAGGAAGDDLRMKSTHVGLGGHVSSDAVVLAMIFSESPLGVGVCHGHRPLSEVMTVTRTEGAIVREINGRPAWDVWKEHTRERALALNLDPDHMPEEEIGAYSLRFEAGLKNGDDYKIRAPLSRLPDGSLSFACGIPEGAEIQITESEPARQVESAREAARRARASLSTRNVAGAIVFDCICRNLILNEQFAGAVRGIAEELGDMPVAGFETYGEIALAVGDLSGFHNTTSVVLAFPGPLT